MLWMSKQRQGKIRDLSRGTAQMSASMTRDHSTASSFSVLDSGDRYKCFFFFFFLAGWPRKLSTVNKAAVPAMPSSKQLMY